MEALGFDALVAGYLMGYDPVTRKRYRCNVRDWLGWCRDNLVDPMGARLVHIEGYMRWLRDVRGLSKESVRASGSAVHGLYRYAVSTGALDRDPFAGIRLPRAYGHSEGTCLDRDGAARFLAEAGRRSADVRALCRVLLLCGLRVSEAVSLDVSDYSPGASPTVSIRARKGDWSQTVSVAPAVAEAFDGLVAKRSTGPLIRCRGRRMNVREAHAAVVSVAQAIGEDGITPHSLRRTFATLSRDAGVSDLDIQASGGWTSTRMLDYYDMGRRAKASSAPAALEAYLGAPMDDVDSSD